MTPELEQRLREAGADFVEVWPGSEIWAPRSRVEEIRAAVLEALEKVVIDQGADWQAVEAQTEADGQRVREALTAPAGTRWASGEDLVSAYAWFPA